MQKVNTNFKNFSNQRDKTKTGAFAPAFHFYFQSYFA